MAKHPKCPEKDAHPPHIIEVASGYPAQCDGYEVPQQKPPKK